MQIFGLDIGIHGIAVSDGYRWARYIPGPDLSSLTADQAVLAFVALTPAVPKGAQLWVESMRADDRTERAQMHAILKLQLIAGALVHSHGARLVPAGVWSRVPKEVRGARLALDPEAAAVIASAMPPGLDTQIPKGRTLDVVDAFLIARWARHHGDAYARRSRGWKY